MSQFFKTQHYKIMESKEKNHVIDKRKKNIIIYFYI